MSLSYPLLTRHYTRMAFTILCHIPYTLLLPRCSMCPPKLENLFARYSLGFPASMPFLMLFPLAGAPFPISACSNPPRPSLLAQALHETFLPARWWWMPSSLNSSHNDCISHVHATLTYTLSLLSVPELPEVSTLRHVNHWEGLPTQVPYYFAQGDEWTKAFSWKGMSG